MKGLCTVTYKFTCWVDGCDSVVEGESVNYQPGHIVMAKPTPPAGWIVLGAVYVCPKHEVKIEDKK